MNVNVFRALMICIIQSLNLRLTTAVLKSQHVGLVSAKKPNGLPDCNTTYSVDFNSENKTITIKLNSDCLVWMGVILGEEDMINNACAYVYVPSETGTQGELTERKMADSTSAGEIVETINSNSWTESITGTQVEVIYTRDWKGNHSTSFDVTENLIKFQFGFAKGQDADISKQHIKDGRSHACVCLEHSDGTGNANCCALDISTTQTYDSHEQDYSLSGAFTVTDSINNELFVVKIEVDSDCSNIKFDFMLSGNNGWFSIGIGGDYELASSESHSADAPVSEAVNMNGYAIVVMGIDDVYESTLQVGAAPARQRTNNLDCKGIYTNGITRIECTRPYYTNDVLDEDFYEFIYGVNPIIYAWGPIGDDGIAIQHGANTQSYGEAHKGVIYMNEGYALCEYASKYAMNVNSAGTNEFNPWMIVAIISILVAVGAICGSVIVLVRETKSTDKQGKYVKTSQQTTDIIAE